VYGALSSAKILQQQYYARDLVLRLTLLPERNQLAFEICTTYVPVKVPCACRILQVTGTEEILGGEVIWQHWTMDNNRVDLNLLNREGTPVEQTQKLQSASPGFATFQYVCQFKDKTAYTEKQLSDTHVFKFFCGSARVEAYLPPGFHLYVSKGTELMQGREIPLISNDETHKYECCLEGAWAIGDSFTWCITPTARAPANSGSPGEKDAA
jgi:hypothetical protein